MPFKIPGLSNILMERQTRNLHTKNNHYLLQNNSISLKRRLHTVELETRRRRQIIREEPVGVKELKKELHVHVSILRLIIQMQLAVSK